MNDAQAIAIIAAILRAAPSESGQWSCSIEGAIDDAVLLLKQATVANKRILDSLQEDR